MGCCQKATFLQILSFIFDFLFFPRFGVGTITLCLFIFQFRMGGGAFPAFPPASAPDRYPKSLKVNHQIKINSEDDHIFIL